MTTDDYIFLYGKLDISKIPDDIHTKIMNGENFSEKDEIRIKSIIERAKKEEVKK